MYLSYKQLAIWGLPSDVSVASSPVVDPENLEIFMSKIYKTIRKIKESFSKVWEASGRQPPNPSTWVRPDLFYQ